MLIYIVIGILFVLVASSLIKTLGKYVYKIEGLNFSNVLIALSAHTLTSVVVIYLLLKLLFVPVLGTDSGFGGAIYILLVAGLTALLSLYFIFYPLLKKSVPAINLNRTVTLYFSGLLLTTIFCFVIIFFVVFFFHLG